MTWHLNAAPSGDTVTDYDRRHLALYAALLDADAVGKSWPEVARTIMRSDPDQEDAEKCWRSHLERARWITGAGLASALEAFGQPEIQSRS